MQVRIQNDRRRKQSKVPFAVFLWFFRKVSSDPDLILPLRLFCALCSEINWLKVPRAAALCESRLAAREEAVSVRGKHFGNCFFIFGTSDQRERVHACARKRSPPAAARGLQKLFDVLMF